MSCYEITFSATGGTDKITEAVFKGMNARSEAFSSLTKIDLKMKDRVGCEFDPEDICLIGVPSFAGRVPAVAAERIRALKGNGAKAVLIVSFGNRAIDDTLLELKEIVLDAGFVPAAALEAVAEHSLMHQFAAGRPDASDLKELAAFGERIAEVILSGSFDADLKVPGNKPYRPLHPASVFPVVVSDCSGCGDCAAVCPVGAIDPAEPSGTDRTRCIGCMACTAACKTKARQADPEMIAALTARLGDSLNAPKKNACYL